MIFLFFAAAVLADLMDWYAHSLTFLVCAVFLVGVELVCKAIRERGRP